MVRGARVFVTAVALLVPASGCVLISGVSELEVDDGSSVDRETGVGPDVATIRADTDAETASDADTASDSGTASDASDGAADAADAADAAPVDAGPDALVDAAAEAGGCTTKSTAATTPSNVTASGSGNAWSSLANVKVQDDVGATAAGCCAGDDSQTLLATGFGFAISASAEIRGVTVAIRAKGKSQASDKLVKLAVAGAAAGTDLENATYTTSFVTRTYGGATNTWGLSLTPAIVDAADFGVAIRTSKPAFRSDTAEIDVVTVTVHYCE